jgi:hypothetical protein
VRNALAYADVDTNIAYTYCDGHGHTYCYRDADSVRVTYASSNTQAAPYAASSAYASIMG